MDMNPLALLNRWKSKGRTFVELAKLCGIRSTYINDVRTGRHRFRGDVAARMATVFRAAGLIPDTDLAELQFQLACRNMPLEFKSIRLPRTEATDTFRNEPVAVGG